MESEQRVPELNSETPVEAALAETSPDPATEPNSDEAAAMAPELGVEALSTANADAGSSAVIENVARPGDGGDASAEVEPAAPVANSETPVSEDACTPDPVLAGVAADDIVDQVVAEASSGEAEEVEPGAPAESAPAVHAHEDMLGAALAALGELARTFGTTVERLISLVGGHPAAQAQSVTTPTRATDEASAEPVSAESVPEEPAAAEPVGTEPAEVETMAAATATEESVTPGPTAVASEAEGQAMPEPEAAEPVAAEAMISSVMIEDAAADAGASEPAAREPIADEPLTLESVVPEPAAEAIAVWEPVEAATAQAEGELDAAPLEEVATPAAAAETLVELATVAEAPTTPAVGETTGVEAAEPEAPVAAAEAVTPAVGETAVGETAVGETAVGETAVGETVGVRAEASAADGEE